MIGSSVSALKKNKITGPAFWIGVAIAVTLSLALRTWTLMLLLGALHSDVLETIHPIGFWTTFPIAFLVGWVFPGSTSAKSA